ncbi:MAG TPA: formylglycine-generating enzyme family protein, partial [Saprospiraceae bacterium]|nr:formylglycine-generating enzyme family protein [Saprospiraceae bacterium]
NLRYEDALQKIKAAASLGALKPEVAKAYLEIAFWYGETGNAQRAKNILDSAALVVSKKIDSDQPHRKAIESFDPGMYAKLMERYYPVMVQVEGGIFDMGCDPEKRCKDLHKQEVSSFQMAKYETTWWQYLLFCKATGHEYESPGWGTEGDNPAVYLSWYDAVKYCNWVSKQLGETEAISEKGDGKYSMSLRGVYRLPTEAEWEYAAKGGSRADNTIYSGSNDLDSVGWYSDNSGSRARAVGQKKANGLGLYDMSGNVWEWCWDWYGDYKPNSEKDYKGPDNGSLRVIRGGSWLLPAGYCRAAYRDLNSPDSRYNYFGFRLVFVP